MQRERDVLTRLIFPEISREAAKREINLREIDLRWGVTKTMALDGGAIGVCLDGVQRCAPCVLGVVGHRHGWVPDDAMLSQFIAERGLPPTDGASLTEIELRYAAMLAEQMGGKPIPVLMRSRELSDQTKLLGEESSPSTGNDDFRRWLRDSPAIDLMNYETMQGFEEEARRLITKMIANSAEMQMKAARHSIATSDTSQFLERPRLRAALNKQARRKAPLLILSAPGAGTTSLLKDWLSSRENGQYYDGKTQDIAEIAEILASSPDRSAQSEQGSSARDIIAGHLLGFGKSDRPCALAFDHFDHADLTMAHADISWLPSKLPASVSITVTTNQPRLADQASDLGWDVLELDPLDRDSVLQVGLNHLASYGKSLTDDQVSAISRAPWGQSLSASILALGELRRHGNFETLDARLAELLQCETEVDLVDEVVDGIAQALPSPWDQTVKPLLVAISISLKGLTQNEICKLAGLIVNQNASSSGDIEAMPSRFWLAIEIALSSILTQREGRIDIAQGVAEQWVEALLTTSPSIGHSASEMLAQILPSMRPSRRAEEAPRLALFVGGAKGLEACLCKAEVLKDMMDKDPASALAWLGQLPGEEQDRVITFWEHSKALTPETRDSLQLLLDEAENSAVTRWDVRDPPGLGMDETAIEARLKSLIDEIPTDSEEALDEMLDWLHSILAGKAEVGQRLPRLIADIEQAISLFRRSSRDDLRTFGLIQALGQAALLVPDMKNAQRLFKELENVARQLGVASALCRALERQAAIALDSNKFRKARKLANECLHLAHAGNLAHFETLALEQLVEVEMRRANWDEAYVICAHFLERANVGAVSLRRARQSFDALENQ